MTDRTETSAPRWGSRVVAVARRIAGAGALVSFCLALMGPAAFEGVGGYANGLPQWALFAIGGLAGVPPWIFFL